ncbi:hypothetical protein YM304_12370 [Ilumatobacter coccineus YM16-304]|uniref:Uncharacterized protein n=2 Tax=Ilumatobacter coccineus TaxID=467094 RepID=A0A6C7E4M1_ILUCY|nr:hypothetical protein YM304_12370 [Ilumatobacter coccineus YM16-304]
MRRLTLDATIGRVDHHPSRCCSPRHTPRTRPSCRRPNSPVHVEIRLRATSKPGRTHSGGLAERLEQDCKSTDDGREFRWADRADTVRWMSFVSFAALKSTLLISGLVADSTTTRILAAIALIVAFIAEELSANRVVVAAKSANGRTCQ